MDTPLLAPSTGTCDQGRTGRRRVWGAGTPPCPQRRVSMPGTWSRSCLAGTSQTRSARMALPTTGPYPLCLASTRMQCTGQPTLRARTIRRRRRGRASRRLSRRRSCLARTAGTSCRTRGLEGINMTSFQYMGACLAFQGIFHLSLPLSLSQGPQLGNTTGVQRQGPISLRI